MKKKKLCTWLFLTLSIGLVAGCDRVADTDLVGYAYPSVATVAAMSHSRETYNLPFNELVHRRELIDHHGASGIVSPNNDTLYSGVSLDMSESPQIIELPPIDDGRYQSLMITDMRAYNVAEFVNNGSGGRYMFVVKGYQGGVPDDVQLVEAESDVLLAIIRTEVFDAADLPDVYLIQDQISVSALLPVKNNHTVSPDLPEIDLEDLEMSVLGNWVEMAQWAMKHSPELDARDAEYKAKIEELEPGLLNKVMFAYGVYKLKKAGAEMKSTKGFYGPRDQVTNNDWERGAINTFSHLALSDERALYPTYTTDSDGDELVGCESYTITFRDVPVRAFWSFTVYQMENKQFVPDDENRYRVSDKSAVRNADDSVTIHLGGKPNAENYLPLPTDCTPWYTLIRLYEPEESLLNGTWQLPQIVKAN